MLWHIYLIQTSGLPATLSISSLGYNGVTEELPADYHNNLNCYRIQSTPLHQYQQCMVHPFRHQHILEFSINA